MKGKSGNKRRILKTSTNAEKQGVKTRVGFRVQVQSRSKSEILFQEYWNPRGLAVSSVQIVVQEWASCRFLSILSILLGWTLSQRGVR